MCMHMRMHMKSRAAPAHRALHAKMPPKRRLGVSNLDWDDGSVRMPTSCQTGTRHELPVSNDWDDIDESPAQRQSRLPRAAQAPCGRQQDDDELEVVTTSSSVGLIQKHDRPEPKRKAKQAKGPPCNPADTGGDGDEGSRPDRQALWLRSGVCLLVVLSLAAGCAGLGTVLANPAGARHDDGEPVGHAAGRGDAAMPPPPPPPPQQQQQQQQQQEQQQQTVHGSVCICGEPGCTGPCMRLAPPHPLPPPRPPPRRPPPPPSPSPPPAPMVCDRRACTSDGNDCCAPSKLGEAATCAEGYTVVRHGAGDRCFGFAGGFASACLLC